MARERRRWVRVATTGSRCCLHGCGVEHRKDTQEGHRQAAHAGVARPPSIGPKGTNRQTARRTAVRHRPAHGTGTATASSDGRRRPGADGARETLRRLQPQRLKPELPGATGRDGPFGAPAHGRFRVQRTNLPAGAERRPDRVRAVNRPRPEQRRGRSALTPSLNDRRSRRRRATIHRVRVAVRGRATADPVVARPLRQPRAVQHARNVGNAGSNK